MVAVLTTAKWRHDIERRRLFLDKTTTTTSTTGRLFAARGRVCDMCEVANPAWAHVAPISSTFLSSINYLKHMTGLAINQLMSTDRNLPRLSNNSPKQRDIYFQISFRNNLRSLLLSPLDKYEFFYYGQLLTNIYTKWQTLKINSISNSLQYSSCSQPQINTTTKDLMCL